MLYDGTWQVCLDLVTVTSFTLVNRSWYALYNPILWRQVRLTRPSALRQFHTALLSRPSNAGLVDSIHLGNDSEALLQWPSLATYELGQDALLFCTGLHTRDEALDRLPRWC